MERKVLQSSDEALTVEVLLEFCTNQLRAEDVPSFLSICNSLCIELKNSGAVKESEEIKEVLNQLKRVVSLTKRKKLATRLFSESQVITWQDFEMY